MKPKWKDLPEWAKWLAQDGNGVWWCYQCKPKRMKRHSIWANASVSGKGRAVTAIDFSRSFDWDKTLEKRP